MLFLVPVPVRAILVLWVLCVVVAPHALLFLVTIGPVALAAVLLVRWAWAVKDRRRLARLEAQYNNRSIDQ